MKIGFRVALVAILLTAVELVLARNVVDCYQTCLEYCLPKYGGSQHMMEACMDGCLFTCEIGCP